ncbi:DUF6728 family protein [Nafulsella turpanensis]|uniref:DUF6728 family protein n=1 Tax=Nafulsella turpanensis TaxID=1265690 RepID=UPI000346F950|nr:DUF6728 family protein [Nafulsella turpanensis]
MDNKNRNTLADYFKLGEVFGYFFRKKDPNRPTNFSLKAMHGINKLSILMFLAGVIFMILKRVI